MKRAAVILAVLSFFVWALDRAWDQELASGGVLSERDYRGDGQGSERVTHSGPIRRGLANASHALVAKTSARSESAPPPVTKQVSAAQATYQGRPLMWWVRKAVQNKKDANARGHTIKRLRAELANRSIGPTLAIRLVFGAYADAALRVAWCESRWHTGASNGQYLGLFQMGDYARGRYGHSSSALGQARAAYAYFVASGRDWSPWECRP